MDAIFTRVSTRNFEARKVESKYIIKILRAAMAAPSAANQQEWEFYVTEDKDIISQLSQVTPYAKPAQNAPVVIIPCYNLDVLRVSLARSRSYDVSALTVRRDYCAGLLYL